MGGLLFIDEIVLHFYTSYLYTYISYQCDIDN